MAPRPSLTAVGQEAIYVKILPVKAAAYIFLMMQAIMQANILPEELLDINIMYRPVSRTLLKPVRLNMMWFWQLTNPGLSPGPVLSAVMA